MKKRIFALLLVLCLCLGLVPAVSADGEGVPIDETNFPDAAFRSFVKTSYDDDRDGYLSSKEILLVLEINIIPALYMVEDVTGIEVFKNLQTFKCNANLLKKLDLSKNTGIKYVECDATPLEELNLTGCRSLLSLHCNATALTKLDVTGCPLLANLDCAGNQLTELDLSGNTLLAVVDCSLNKLKTLKLSSSALNILENLNCSGNELTELDLSKSTLALAKVNCSVNKLQTLKLSSGLTFAELICSGNELTELDTSPAKSLAILTCDHNKLTALDLTKNSAMTALTCNNNELTSLDLSACKNLSILACGNNHIPALELSHLQHDSEDVELYFLDTQYVTTHAPLEGFFMSELVGAENVSRIRNLSTGSIDENGVLHTNATEVGYDYDTGFILSDKSTATQLMHVVLSSDYVPHQHSYGEWQVHIAPTCTEQGIDIRYCACGAYEIRYVPALGHDYVGGECIRCHEKEPTACPQAKFSDKLPEDHWAHESIDYVLNRGIMSGTSDTTFDPNGTVTRAMVAVMLHNLAGEPAATIKNPFTDVKDSDWFAPSVTWAFENGVASGNEDGTFNPDGKITREQLAIMMCNFADFKGLYKPADFDLSRFADQSSVSPWAVDAIKWACANGIVSGSDDGSKLYLLPLDTATRMQMAVIFQNFCETFGI